MRVLLALLLIAIVGCGDGSSPPGGGQPSRQAADAGAALEEFEGAIDRNAEGEVIKVDRQGHYWKTPLAEITDARLLHLKGLTNLKTLDLTETQVTDAGLVHLKGLTNLQTLRLHRNNKKITDADIAELKKALPKCRIQLRCQPHRPTPVAVVRPSGLNAGAGVGYWGTVFEPGGM